MNNMALKTLCLLVPVFWISKFILKNFRIRRVYIVNSTRPDCIKDIKAIINMLDEKPYYSWKLISSIYLSTTDIKKLRDKFKLYINILFCNYVLIPEYKSVSVEDEILLNELKIAGIFRKEIRWYKK